MKLEDAQSPFLTFDEQASDPTTPAAGLWIGYFKSGGLYARNAAGTVVGPFSAGGSVATDAIYDAKGDLPVGTGANTAARLAVGTNGQVLTADSGETTGAKWATPSASSGSLLASTIYNPGTLAAPSTTSTSLADVDATNLAVTFTVPASGMVIVTLSALVSVVDSGTSMSWGLRSGSSDVSGTIARMLIGNTTGTLQSRITYPIPVSGLTPAASLTYKFAHARDAGSGTTQTIYGGIVGAASILVHEDS